MKGERKPGLKLVPPVGPSGGGGDEPPFTEDELREAVATREAVERGDEPVSSSLRAAWRPAPLDDEAHAALVERAFKEVEARREEGGEALAEPDEAELAAAERLRAALDELGPGSRPGRAPPSRPVQPTEGAVVPLRGARAGRAPGAAPEPGAEIAAALRAAYRPTALDPRRNEVLIATALANAPRRRSMGRVIALVTTVTALAAGFALLLRTAGDAAAPSAAPAAAVAAAPSPQPSLIPARSTADLFDAAEPFPRTGGESKRIDRIAAARSADLRANRFAAWGVR